MIREELVRFKRVGNKYQIHIRGGEAFEGDIEQISEYAVNIKGIDKHSLVRVINLLENGQRVASLYGYRKR